MKFLALAPVAVGAITTSIPGGIAPVLEVLNKELQNQHNEGEKLAVAYTKTSCDCNNIQNEKETLKKDKEDLIAQKQAAVEGLNADLSALKEGIDSLNGVLAETNSALENTKDDKEVTLANITATLKQAQMDLFAVKEATRVLKTAVGEPVALVQRAQKILSKQGITLPSDHTHSSGAILDLMATITGDLSGSVTEQQQYLTDEKNRFNAEIQELTSAIQTNTQRLDAATREQTEKSETLAAENEVLSSAQQALQITSDFLNVNYAECKNEKNAYDQEQGDRKSALTVLHKVVGIIEGINGPAPPSFLEMSSTLNSLKRRLMLRKSPIDEAQSVLKSAADRLHSNSLSTLVTKMAAKGSSFDAITEMIETLIARMSEEGRKMQEQHEWCNHETERTHAAVDKLTDSFLAERAAIVEKVRLMSEIQAGAVDVRKEIVKFMDQMKTSEETRSVEAAANDEALKTNQEGLAAIGQALDEIRNHFGGETTNEVKGIVGMLQVTSGKYEDMIASTQALDKQQADDHAELSQQITMSLDKLEHENNNFMQSMGSNLDKKSTAVTNYQDAYTGLQTELEQYTGVVKSCSRRGKSFEEREAERQAEVAALQDALEILSENE